MRIDIKSTATLKETLTPLLEKSTLNEAQLGALERAVRCDSVTIKSINDADISDEAKATAVLMMLMRNTPDDVRHARVSQNLADFFNRVLSGKETKLGELMRVASLGVAPLSGAAEIRNIGPDSVDIVAPAANQKVTFKGQGEIDVSAARTWTVETLETVVAKLASARARNDDTLLGLLREDLDGAAHDILGRTQTALDGVLREKRGAQAAGVEALQSAVNHPTAPRYEVPQVNIDAVGRALAVPLGALPAPTILERWKNPAELKAAVVASVTSMTLDEARAVTDAIRNLKGGAISAEAARQAGLSPRAVELLVAFTSLRSRLADAAVKDAVANQPSAREAALAVLRTQGLDAALGDSLTRLRDPDPFGLQRGQSERGSFAANATAQEVRALSTAEGVQSYQIAIKAAVWTFSSAGIAFGKDPPMALADFSIDALRAFTSALLAASSASAPDTLAYFRQAEERESGGFSLAKLLDDLSATLASKVTARLDEMHATVEALQPLKTIEAPKAVTP